MDGGDIDGGTRADRPVVVGLDGSVGSREAALFAARSARRRGTRLEAVVAVEPPRPEGRAVAAAAGFPLAPLSATADRTRRMARGMLDDVVHQVRREDGEAPRADVVTVIGGPAEVVVDAAKDAVELVLGHRGLGTVSSVLLGSVGMASVLHASCPVTVVPVGVPGGAGVVVGVDGRGDSRAALVHAVREAARRGTSVTAVVAYPAEDATWPAGGDLPPWPQDLCRIEVDRARGFVDETLAALRPDTAALPPVEVVGALGSPTAALTEAARDAALLVVGHRERGVLRSTLLGSIGLGCVLHAVCPVTVVPVATSAREPESATRPPAAATR
jgi:nucleotide-binding universal stress UspA family protein